MLLLLVAGYPYAITKSAVASLAPHSWPQLCHALVWLARAVSAMPTVVLHEPKFMASIHCIGAIDSDVISLTSIRV